MNQKEVKNQVYLLKQNINLLVSGGQVDKNELSIILYYLCQNKAKIQIQQISTICKYCNILIDIKKDKNFTKHENCLQYYHQQCIYQQARIINNPLNLDQINILNCLECGMKHSEQLIRTLLKKEIQQKMEELSQEEAKKIQQIWDKQQREEWKKEAQNKSFQCEICYDDKNIDQEGLTICNENHRFCRECLKAHILSSYKENQGNVYCPNCPQQQDQRQEISVYIIQNVLNEQEYQKLDEFQVQNLFNNQDNFMRCVGYIQKKQNQDGSIIKLNYNELEKLALGEKANLNVEITDCPNIWEKNGDIKDIKRIDCQICGLKICLLCDKPEHKDSTCEQFAEYLKTKGKEDEKTLEYLRQNFRDNIQCPSCRNIVTKSSGCNHMTCRCGFQFCYLCGGDWRNHRQCQQRQRLEI